VFLLILILLPLIGLFIISATLTFNTTFYKTKMIKIIALSITVIDFLISLIVYLLFDNSSKQFQFVQEQYQMSSFDFYLGIDGLSIYFVLLTTFIMPISLISN
jgi:NADH-ubiquinone oxidoreductase chain 4